MKQLHHPWDKKTFEAGANSDVTPEVVARTPGQYLDAQNMRIADGRGKTGSMAKLRGEALIVGPDQPGDSTYVCIGAIFVKGRRISFWASTEPDTYPPIVQVDGVTMAMSESIPYLWDRKLQLHASEDCDGGIVFDARSGSIPLHWPIGDMIAAYEAGLSTFFDAFEVSAYQANSTRPQNRPRFRGLENVGDGNGVKSSQREYVVRYVNAEGDRTPDGQPLGPVMVPFVSNSGQQTPQSPAWPESGIAGAAPLQVGIRTGMAVKLRIRVNNIANFDSIEVVCTIRDLDGGTDAVPSVKVVHRQAVSPGESEWYDILDTGIELDSIGQDDSVIQTFFIREANSVRYVNYRVVYGGVILGKKNVRGEFIGGAGERTIPFTKRLGTKGHSDPVNHCYHRRFQSGERHAIGAVYVDAVGGHSYVDIIEDGVQLPDRRTPKVNESADLSDAPCTAANTSNVVGPTFEVFDHDNAVGRSQFDQVVNIMMEGRRNGGTDTFVHQANTTTPDPNQDFFPYEQNNDGVYADSGLPGGPYIKTDRLKPFRPCHPNDYKFGLDYRANTSVGPQGSGAATPVPYNPKVFDVEHHALGLAVKGLSAPPEGTQGVSIVASKPAGRVVTQAIAKWSLINGDIGTQTPATKQSIQIHVCFPDFNSSYLGQTFWDGIRNNPQAYQLQLVSPLGFCTEQFGSVMALINPALASAGAYSVLSDSLSIARVLWDTGQINPGTNFGGASPAIPLPGGQDHFTAFGAWRNAIPSAMPWGGTADTLIDILQAQEIEHESGLKSMKLTMAAPIYNTLGVGNATDFNNGFVQAFHEPWYVVNIIQNGAVPDDLAGFNSLNHYQAWVSDIGATDGLDGQRLYLVDENIDIIHTTATGQERFVWVRSPDGSARRHLYIGAFWAQYATIEDSIINTGSWTTPGGVEIFGVYDVHFEPTPQDAFVLLFGAGLPISGSRIEIRYPFDGSIPMKAYGDMISSPAVTTMVDASGTANGAAPQGVQPFAGHSSGSVQYPIFIPDLFLNGDQVLRTAGLPIPFANYFYNPRYFVPFGTGANIPGTLPQGNAARSINQFAGGMMVSVRQWKVVFDCEVRSPLYLGMFEQGTGNRRSYPDVNYVQRPYNYGVNSSLEDNGVFPAYGELQHYPGDNASVNWHFGGFYSKQRPNTDHRAIPEPRYFRFPEFGHEEEENQCNLLVYSAKDSPLVQDSPALKTFPVLNAEFIENDRGMIQRLFSGGASNLFVITEGATFEVLIEKSTAYSADGTDFSTFAQDKFIGQVVARSKNVGMPGATWMTAAEGAPLAGSSRQDALMWYDGTSSQILMGSAVGDTAIHHFREALRNAYTDTPGPVAVCAAYDKERDELFTNLGDRTLIRGSRWMGGCDYRFDQMLYGDRQMYGFRNLSTYLLDSGDQMGGEPVVGWILVPSSPFPGERMEWERVKVNSDRKPTRIEFFDESGVMVSWMDEATFGRWWMKRETDWEHYVPRGNASVDPDKKRLQGKVASYRIIFAEAGDDSVVASEVQVKQLK